MYKCLEKSTFEEYSQFNKNVCKDKILLYQRDFENAGLGFKYTIKKACKQYYDKDNEKIICAEVVLYNSNQSDFEKVNSTNAKKISMYMYKYKKINDKYYYKSKKDFFFDLIMNRYMKMISKNGAEKFLKENIVDFFLRFFCPRRCGSFGDTYRGKDLLKIKIVLTAAIAISASVAAGIKHADFYESMGW